MEKPLSNPVAFYFKLSFKDEDTAFQEVSGITQELGIDEVTEGGENRFKHRLPKPVKYQNLVLKKGLVQSNSALLNWCQNTQDNGLSEPVIPHDVKIQLLNQEGKVMMSWSFHQAYPVKYSISDLKSNENKVIVETIELAYTYFDITHSV